MAAIDIKDIQLKEFSLDNLPLLNTLKKQLFTVKKEVCIERAVYVTQYLKDMADAEDSMEVRYAKAVNHFLSNKAAFFLDDNLIAGTTTSKQMGAPVYPELTGMTIWPELETISNRDKNPLILSKNDADTLNFDVFSYWIDKNVLEVTRTKYKEPLSLKLLEQFVFYIAGKAGCISHTVPNYRVVLDKGLNYIINDASIRESELRRKKLTDEEMKKADFYKAVQISLTGIINYASNLSKKAKELAEKENDLIKKKNLTEMAMICSRVPAEAASTFREAINSLWLIQIGIHAENINMAMSPGRLDQILYKFYKKDIEEGRLTVKEALELSGCLWIKLNDNVNLVPETAEELFGGAGTVPAVTLGGVDENGEDAVNDLTYIMLKATELLAARDPSVNARYHYEKNSKEYRNRVCEVIATTKAVPAFHNDVADIAVLKNQNIKTEHARDYAIIGCVELSSSGRSYDASSSVMLNLVAALELALYNGRRPVTGDTLISMETGDPASCSTFEEFLSAFEKQFKWLAGKAIELNEFFGHVHQEILPTPLLSAFFEGPMESGRDIIFGGALYNSSGATHIGFADTVDSLNAIESAVFIDEKYSFGEIIQAIKNDFINLEDMRQYLLNKTPKYGTEHPVAGKNSRYLVKFLYDFYQGYTNYRGGKYRPAYWSMTNHSGQGALSGALPSGRGAYQSFASGITPVSGSARELSAALKSIGELGAVYIPGGEALNLKYTTVKGNEDIDKFGSYIESYFKAGGLHVQFNIMSRQMLEDAKKNPERYNDLTVRVSGYSAYFNDLNEKMKDEIITRTEYDLTSGRAVSFGGNNA